MSEDNLYQPLLNEEDGTHINFSSFFDKKYLHNIPCTPYLSSFPTTEALLHYLKTDCIIGLDTSNVDLMQWRKNTFGDNYYEHSSPISFIDYLANYLNDYIIMFILFFSLCNIALGYFGMPLYEGIALINIVAFAVVISSYFAYRKDLKYEAIKKVMNKRLSNVLRDGKNKIIDTNELLVGDILLLQKGDIVPSVDGVVLEGEFSVSEEKIDPDKKNEDLLITKRENDLIFSSSKIYSGYGKIAICEVGLRCYSERSTVYNPLRLEKTKSIMVPRLNRQIERLASTLGNLGVVVSVFVLFAMISKEIITRLNGGIKILDLSFVYIVFNTINISLTLLLISLPQGLPKILSIATAYSLTGMMSENALIKSPTKVEMIGSINQIVTDCTGILTKAEFDIKDILINGKVIQVNNEEKTLIGEIYDEEKELIMQCLNSTMNNIVVSNETIMGNGSAVDKTFYNFIKQQRGYKNLAQGLYVLPFKSEYKYTISIFEHENKYVLYFKGRFDSTEHFIDKIYSNFTFVPYEGKIKQSVHTQLSKNSDKAYDTILFAKKEISSLEMLTALKKYPNLDKEMFDSLAKGSSMLCLISLFNPPRDKVNDGITECLDAGIGVRMVTSHETDNALATAMNVDLISMEEYVEATKQLKEIKGKINELSEIKDAKSLPQPICLTGKDFTLLTGGMTKDDDVKDESGLSYPIRHLNDPKRFKRIVKRLKVITEASTEDKLLLVFGLQQIGKIVGVTGKSSLDEKIFRYSNLGIALGVSGKEMTKEASDLILLDDSFNALVSALKYGRNINSSVRKYIQFSITASIVTYSIVVIGVLMMTDCPLGAAEIIWLNVIIDTFASIALLSEQPDDLRYHKEKKNSGRVVTSFMKVTIVAQAVYEIAILLVILVFGDDIFGIMTDWNFRHITWNQTNGYHFTLFFTVLIYFQVFNSINCRKINKNQKNVFSGLIKHYHFILYEGLLILIHLFLVSFGGKGLRVKPLSFTHHLVCMGFAATCLLVDLILKVAKYKEKKVHKKVKKEDEEEDLVLLANVIQNTPQKVFTIGDLLNHTKLESI